MYVLLNRQGNLVGLWWVVVLVVVPQWVPGGIWVCRVWRRFGWKSSTEDGGDLITEAYITWTADMCDAVVVL